MSVKIILWSTIKILIKIKEKKNTSQNIIDFSCQFFSLLFCQLKCLLVITVCTYVFRIFYLQLNLNHNICFIQLPYHHLDIFTSTIYQLQFLPALLPVHSGCKMSVFTTSDQNVSSYLFKSFSHLYTGTHVDLYVY